VSVRADRSASTIASAKRLYSRALITRVGGEQIRCCEDRAIPAIAGFVSFISMLGGALFNGGIARIFGPRFRKRRSRDRRVGQRG
jgi:hypothetical protein